MIYEDQLLTISTPQKPVVKGHIVIQKDGVPESAEDFAHLLSAASFSSMILFEQLGAHGTNILLTGDHAHILARTESDGLNLLWTPQEFTPQELDDLAARIKDKCDFIADFTEGSSSSSAPKRNSSSVSSSSQSPSSSDSSKKNDSTLASSKDAWPKQTNYLLKQLDRMP